MKFKIFKKQNLDIPKNELKVTIEFSNIENSELEEFENYLKEYKPNKVLVNDGYKSIFIEYKNIVKFYSEKKNNYCKTNDGNIYKIKSKLYELENSNKNFIRISKNCIININFVKYFDKSITGKLIVKLEDDTEEEVSRRRIRKVMNFLEDKSI